jgi:hypothetical protein
MLGDRNGRTVHDKFKELCALAYSGNLSPLEMSELEAHLQHCGECHEAFLQYRTLTTQGMAILAETYAEQQEETSWNETSARERLLARVQADQQALLEHRNRPAAAPRVAPAPLQSGLANRARTNPFVWMALAACLILGVGIEAYRHGVQAQKHADAELFSPSLASVDDRYRQLLDEKKTVDELLADQGEKLAQLQEQSSEKEQELAKLRSALRTLEDHSRELEAANSRSDEQLKVLTQQRDGLNAQVQAANQAYQNDRTELASLRAERDKTLLRTTSLESRLGELTAKNQDQERRLKDTEQYLASDRDIRELMGARKLYIADVFDVDSSSRTQKPFGRVFYTQGKSLIFYAFDLDREPGVVNASTFQVWGQREAPQGEQPSPMNLGILYMDNESNRRWVMRFDDPKQLAEIDAVFVTVEPRGGSHTPTGKPFLYALLRNEANHP